MSIALLIGQLVIPVAVLLVDYGRRRLTAMRILRPFIATAIVLPFVLPGFDLRGAGLALEAGACLAGIALGLLAAAAMRVEQDGQTGRPMTVAGVPYLAIWVVFCAARLAFTYESEHSVAFQRALGRFLVTQHISVTSLADSVMLIGFAMLIAQRGTLFLRARSALIPDRVAAAAPTVGDGV